MDTVGTFEMAKALGKVSMSRQLSKVRNRSVKVMREGDGVAGSRLYDNGVLVHMWVKECEAGWALTTHFSETESYPLTP
jgi:hypothetical protein